MEYAKYTFDAQTAQQNEAIIAVLEASEKFTGFEEMEDGRLIAYAINGQIEDDTIRTLLDDFGISFRKDIEKEQNWNSVWESNFPPVVLPGFCGIRADFHQPIDNLRHEIIITPKMSFGTGHHATTKLMMSLMKDLDFQGKTVFDFGTGTGILAILAKKMGAEEVLAIDIDDWSYVNAQENVAKNTQSQIEIQLGGIELIGDRQFDIILANINRQILLESMNRLASALNKDGTILLSGILKDQDIEMIKNSAEEAGLRLLESVDESNWAALRFQHQ